MRTGGRVAAALRGYTEQLNRRLASRGSPASPGGSPSTAGAVGKGGAQLDCIDQPVHRGHLDALARHSVPANGPSKAAGGEGGGRKGTSTRHGIGTLANGSTTPLEGNLESPERSLNGAVVSSREGPGESRSSTAAAHGGDNGNSNISSATDTERHVEDGAAGGAQGGGDARGLFAAGLVRASRERPEGKAAAAASAQDTGGPDGGSSRGKAVESLASVSSSGSKSSPGATGASQGVPAASSSSLKLLAATDGDPEVRRPGNGGGGTPC